MNWNSYRFWLCSASPRGLGCSVRWSCGFLSLSLALMSLGCAVGPNYKRPDYPAPPSHRSETALPTAPPAAPSPTLGDLKWFDLFRDEKLQELIRIALKDNYDVRIAAQRVLAAQAFVTVEKSALFPSV